MNASAQQFFTLVLAASIFGLVLSLWIMAVLAWSAKRMANVRRMQSRLGVNPHPHSGATKQLQLWHKGEQFTTMVPSTENQHGLVFRIERACAAAGWTMNAGMFIMLIFVSLLIVAAFGYVVTKSLMIAIGLSVAAFVVFRIWMLSRMMNRDARFEGQLVDAMDLAARSLRAGHPLLGAFQLIAEEMGQPVSSVFAELCQRHEMGSSLEDSLRDTADSATSADLTLFATSVAIQMRTGGNLSELIDRLADVVRERMRLSRRCRVLTAQTQMSKRVLLALPFIMLVLLTFLNPNYMRPLYSTTGGQIMLGVGAAMLGMGAWIMSRMGVVKY